MVIFWRLVLSHFIADFSLQTNHIAHWKRESVWGMAVHALTHPIVSLVLVWPFLKIAWIHTPWFGLPGSVCVVLIGLSHWLQDEWRIWSIQKLGAPDDTKLFLWDQLVHLCIIAAFAPTFPGPPREIWVFIALCGVLLAHFTSVLIFFLENDVNGTSSVLGEQKYLFIGERLSGAVLFLLPGYGLLLALVWIGWMLYVHYRRLGDRTWIHLAIGNAAVVLLGLAARGFLYQ